MWLSPNIRGPQIISYSGQIITNIIKEHQGQRWNDIDSSKICSKHRKVLLYSKWCYSYQYEPGTA